MLKHILLASAVMISAPALAQDKPMPADPAPVTEAAPAQTAPTNAVPAPVEAAPAPDNVAQAAPVADPVAPAPAEQMAAQPSAAAETPASKQEQVAAIVNKEFPSYDKNKDGKLDTAEFASWMIALKTASDPATKADSPAVKTWVGQAFASADTDKSKSISMMELNAFLSQG